MVDGLLLSRPSSPSGAFTATVAQPAACRAASGNAGTRPLTLQSLRYAPCGWRTVAVRQKSRTRRGRDQEEENMSRLIARSEFAGRSETELGRSSARHLMRWRRPVNFDDDFRPRRGLLHGGHRRVGWRNGRNVIKQRDGKDCCLLIRKLHRDCPLQHSDDAKVSGEHRAAAVSAEHAMVGVHDRKLVADAS